MRLAGPKPPVHSHSIRRGGSKAVISPRLSMLTKVCTKRIDAPTSMRVGHLLAQDQAAAAVVRQNLQPHPRCGAEAADPVPFDQARRVHRGDLAPALHVDEGVHEADRCPDFERIGEMRLVEPLGHGVRPDDGGPYGLARMIQAPLEAHVVPVAGRDQFAFASIHGPSSLLVMMQYGPMRRARGLLKEPPWNPSRKVVS